MMSSIIRAMFLLGTVVLVSAVLGSIAAAQDGEETIPAVQVTPTVDRLAAPPTVENPTQADSGAQLYWLHCQPCHGDQGQGLTDEWRAQYPPEDQNCWTSGCHGNRPYENGFTLPRTVPPLIGEDSLERFQTLGQLYHFIQSAMPYQAPASLDEESYLAITAFLARGHQVVPPAPLTAENIAHISLVNGDLVAPAITVPPVTPTPESVVAVATQPPVAPHNQSPDDTAGQEVGPDSGPVIVAGLIVVIVLLGLLWNWRRRQRASQVTK